LVKEIKAFRVQNTTEKGMLIVKKEQLPIKMTHSHLLNVGISLAKMSSPTYTRWEFHSLK
jgi:hypothetical protein